MMLFPRLIWPDADGSGSGHHSRLQCYWRRTCVDASMIPNPDIPVTFRDEQVAQQSLLSDGYHIIAIVIPGSFIAHSIYVPSRVVMACRLAIAFTWSPGCSVQHLIQRHSGCHRCCMLLRKRQRIYSRTTIIIDCILSHGTNILARIIPGSLVTKSIQIGSGLNSAELSPKALTLQP
jgi:hypothetical protein